MHPVKLFFNSLLLSELVLALSGGLRCIFRAFTSCSPMAAAPSKMLDNLPRLILGKNKHVIDLRNKNLSKILTLGF